MLIEYGKGVVSARELKEVVELYYVQAGSVERNRERVIGKLVGMNECILL